MAISISTTFYPYRLVLSRKQPVELKVELVNRHEKDVMVSLQVFLSKQLSLDKSGLKTDALHRIDKFSPNERKKFVFDVFPKNYVVTGEYPVRVKVLEHYKDYKFVEKEYTKNLFLSVDE